MSKKFKISSNIKRYVLGRKKANPEASCRKLAIDASQRFKLKVSKSSINSILKQKKLSSPIGRSVSRVFRPKAESPWAGFVFLFVANRLLGLTEIIARAIKKIDPKIKMRLDTLEAMTEAWLMAKAIYHIPFTKIEEYTKKELWLITGRKISKGHLKQYISTVQSIQLIANEVVAQLMNSITDVHYIQLTLEHNKKIYIDGQGKGIWPNTDIPICFSTTLCAANSYINALLIEQKPLVVFSMASDKKTEAILSDFILSIDGCSFDHRLQKVTFCAAGGEIVQEVDFVAPARRKFVIGLMPIQAQLMQPIENNNVMLRTIPVTIGTDGVQKIFILTNLGEKEWDNQKVVNLYLDHFPDIKAIRNFFLQQIKQTFKEQDLVFLKMKENITHETMERLKNATDIESFFEILVEILNCYAKKTFFPADCFDWNLLKMREVFYKKSGLIQRDLSEEVVFNFKQDKGLGYQDFLASAALRFNEAGVRDFSNRKLLLKVFK